MLPEPVTAVVSPNDSVASDTQNTVRDSIGSKIIVHHGKIKVVDTTKKDK